PAPRRLGAPAHALRAGQIDEESGALPWRRRERQRRRPVLELTRGPLDLIRREVAGVEPHQHQRIQVHLLERNAGLRKRAGPEHQLLALPIANAAELVELVKIAPFRRYPVAVAKDPKLAV